MASSFTLPVLKSPCLPKSTFLGQNHIPSTPPSTIPKLPLTSISITTAKFNLYEIMGGRGLCNGEEGLQEELKKTTVNQPPPSDSIKDQAKSTSSTITDDIPEDGFEKELLGLTGGFPGGEKGLQRFIERNPPPKKSVSDDLSPTGYVPGLKQKMKAPDLPLFMPGMIALVKNPNSPYYMYCGIVQRITDGKAGVLFEGGNWDRLISFRLDELERREKGPPMVSPRSVALENLVENNAQ